MSRTLEGKRVLVTGGSRGLGAALCRTFADAGASVAFTWERQGEAAAAVARAIEERGGRARAFHCSVLDEAGTDAMVRAIVDEWGGIDALVNNAAITQNLPMALLEVEDFARVMSVNVTGAYVAARAVARPMIRQKSGVILNVGSLAGERIVDAPIHYCASKAALSGMTRALAKELSRHHVRVLCVAPGLLEEGLGQNAPEHRIKDYLQHCALRRLGRLDEVAAFCAFLLSDRASYLTGETVVLDGGL